MAAVDDGRDANEQRAALALLLEQLGPGELAHGLAADGTVGLAVAVRASAAGVNDSFWNPLAVEMRDLLQEVVVLEDSRPTIADGAVVLVIVDRVALAGGQARTLVSILAICAIATAVGRRKFVIWHKRSPCAGWPRRGHR